MENNLLADVFEAELNEEGQAALSEMARWGYINAVVGFISLGISLVVTLITFAKIAGGAAAVTLMASLVSTVISFVLNITLYNSSQSITRSIQNADQGEFVMGLTRLRTYFKILGILTIIVLVIGAFALIAGVFAAVFLAHR